MPLKKKNEIVLAAPVATPCKCYRNAQNLLPTKANVLARMLASVVAAISPSPAPESKR